MKKKFNDSSYSIILLDFNNQVWRSHYATERKMSKNSSGIHTGSILGLIKTLMHAFNQVKIYHSKPKLIICEDRFPIRKRKLYEQHQNAFKDYDGIQKYKGNRVKKDLDYDPVEICQLFMSCIPHTKIFCEKEEADDVLASYICDNSTKRIVLYSTDRDMWQLLDKFPKLSIYLGGDGIKPIDIIEKKFQTKSFNKVILHKVLRGDSGDNVKGVKNYPFKHSIQAYNQCNGTLEDYLHKLTKIYGSENKFIKQILQPHNIELVNLNKKLVELKTDLPYETVLTDKPDWEKWKDLCFTFETPSLLRINLLNLF